MLAIMAADEIDLYAGVPLYLQVAAIIEGEIRAGTWEPGNVVPSRTQLAQRFNVATETARRAMLSLVERGYLASVPGVGMVVTPADRWPAELRSLTTNSGESPSLELIVMDTSKF